MGFDVPFTHLYDAGAFARPLLHLASLCARVQSVAPTMSTAGPNRWRDGVSSSSLCMTRDDERDPSVPGSRICRLQGLQLSVLMQRRVAAAAATMGSTTAGYGCLHARIGATSWYPGLWFVPGRRRCSCITSTAWRNGASCARRSASLLRSASPSRHRRWSFSTRSRRAGVRSQRRAAC